MNDVQNMSFKNQWLSTVTAQDYDEMARSEWTKYTNRKWDEHVNEAWGKEYANILELRQKQNQEELARSDQKNREIWMKEEENKTFAATADNIGKYWGEEEKNKYIDQHLREKQKETWMDEHLLSDRDKTEFINNLKKDKEAYLKTHFGIKSENYDEKKDAWIQQKNLDARMQMLTPYAEALFSSLFEKYQKKVKDEIDNSWNKIIEEEQTLGNYKREIFNLDLNGNYTAARKAELIKGKFGEKGNLIEPGLEQKVSKLEAQIKQDKEAHFKKKNELESSVKAKKETLHASLSDKLREICSSTKEWDNSVNGEESAQSKFYRMFQDMNLLSEAELLKYTDGKLTDQEKAHIDAFVNSEKLQFKESDVSQFENHHKEETRFINTKKDAVHSYVDKEAKDFKNDPLFKDDRGISDYLNLGQNEEEKAANDDFIQTFIDYKKAEKENNVEGQEKSKEKIKAYMKEILEDFARMPLIDSELKSSFSENKAGYQKSLGSKGIDNIKKIFGGTKAHFDNNSIMEQLADLKMIIMDHLYGYYQLLGSLLQANPNHNYATQTEMLKETLTSNLQKLTELENKIRRDPILSVKYGKYINNKEMPDFKFKKIA